MQKVVEKQNLYIHYAQKRSFGYPTEPYKNSPVSVWMTPQEAQKLYAPLKMEITRQPDGSADVTARYVSEREGDEQETTQHFDKLPAILNLPVGVVTLADNTLPKDTLAKAP